MKKMKKVLSGILVCMMMLTLLCIPTAFATEQNADQSVIYEFDAETNLPSVFSHMGGANAGAIAMGNGVLKVTSKASQTAWLRINISDWMGASRKKGILTYSFDYKAEVADVTTHIMVGSTSSGSGHYLAGLQQNRLLGYNGTTGKDSTEWKELSSTENPRRVMLIFNYLNETFSCSMGGKTVSHPFSYYADKTANEQTYTFEDADKFVLYFRTAPSADYNYYIDNFKAEYTENLTYDFYKLTEVPKIFSMMGIGGAVNVVGDALNVTTNAGATESLKVDISDFAVESDKKGILTYSFDYKADTADVTTHIMVGTNSVLTGHVLAGLQQNRLSGHNGTTDSASTEWKELSSTESPRRVVVTFNFLTETFSCSMGGKTVNYPFSYYADKINENKTYTFDDADKYVLYFRTWCKNGYSYNIDNFKVEYTEPAEKFTVKEFAFDNAVVTAGATSTLNYNVVNNHRGNDKVLLVSGVFEDNLLLNCQTRILEFTASNYVADGSLSVNIPADADISKLRVKAFLWENETYKPIIPSAYESANVNPTVHILGDSIYADYTDERYIQNAPDYGIGQALEETGIKVNNKAIPGASTNAWEGNMDSVLTEIEKGDYILISFCHNDQKVVDMDIETYKANILKIANAVKGKGGIPVFITSIPRYLWDNGELKTTHTTEKGNYIQTMIDAGAENGIPVINLNAHLRELYTAEGTNTTSYIDFYSQAEGESLDTTHLSEKGAFYCANWLISQFEAMGFPFV